MEPVLASEITFVSTCAGFEPNRIGTAWLVSQDSGQAETINAAAKRGVAAMTTDVKQDRRRLTHSPELIILGLVIFTFLFQ